MTEFKNPEHFNVAGDKTVTVTVTFDHGNKADKQVAMRNAAYYLTMLANSNEHTSWGRSITIEEKSRE